MILEELLKECNVQQKAYGIVFFFQAKFLAITEQSKTVINISFKLLEKTQICQA